MSTALLCETVTGPTMTDLLTARDAAVGADLVELRLDGVADVDVAAALEGRVRPALVTCRPTCPRRAEPAGHPGARTPPARS